MRTGETIKNESKEQKEGFLRMLLGKSAASTLRNMFTKKSKTLRQGAIQACEGVIKAGEGLLVMSQGQDTSKAGQDC